MYRAGQDWIFGYFCSSGIECKDEIYSCAQLSSVKSEPVSSTEDSQSELPPQTQSTPTPDITTTTICQPQVSPDSTTVVEIVPVPVPVEIELERPSSIVQKLFSSSSLESPTALPRPQTATSKIFAPRTEEMNKGFLMFSEEEPGLTSKLCSVQFYVCVLCVWMLPNSFACCVFPVSRNKSCVIFDNLWFIARLASYIYTV